VHQLGAHERRCARHLVDPASLPETAAASSNRPTETRAIA
jgi:hypothetical protein